MSVQKHNELTGKDLHTQIVDHDGNVKVDVTTTGNDATVRFLESDNKKVVYNYTNNQLDFYINSSSTKIQIPTGLIFSVKEVFLEMIFPIGEYSTNDP